MTSRMRVRRRDVLAGGVATLAGGIAPARAQTDCLDDGRRWDREFDVIVVGFGVAGACAAYEAVRASASVLVVDRAGAEANASHGTKIYMGGGTSLQKACGIHDTPEEMMSYLRSAAGPDPDEERIRVYVERSVAEHEWLVALGVPFSAKYPGGSLAFSGSEQDYPWREAVRPVPRGHIPDVPGAESGVVGGGAWIQRRLLDAVRGAGATLLLAADARRLVRGSDGVLEGLTVEIDGREQRFRARRGLVVCTGGFARNPSMISQHAPSYLRCEPVDLPWNDGWGIRAGQAVGAAVRRMGAASVTWLLYPPASRKQGILVNSLGQRFIAEDAYPGRIGDAIVREQRGSAYLIVDSLTMAAGAARIRDVVAATAASIPELERALGIPTPGLQQTVSTYNRLASTGQDPFLHKARANLRPIDKPPFTAIDASLGRAFLAFFTLGGLATTPKAEVLDTEGRPIPRLYAAGRASAGIPCPYYYASGLSLGECLTFGRIAGIQAASQR